jgi:hypothetical protein
LASAAKVKKKKKAGSHKKMTSTTMEAAAAPGDPSSWVHHCPVCNEKAELRCVRCKGIFYCTVEHQKQHWTAAHRTLCGTKATTAAKTVEAVIDVAAPLFAHGRVFDAVANRVLSVVPQQVDGKAVRVLVTSGNLGRPVAADEYCKGMPELHLAAQCLAKGLPFALAFALCLLEVVNSKATDGRPASLSIRGEPVDAFGVVEHVTVSPACPVLVFFDSEIGQAYASTQTIGKDHGMAWLRTPGKTWFVDFAAAQFSEPATVNSGPAFVCESGSEACRRLYGDDDTSAWQFVDSRSLGDSVRRLLDKGKGGDDGNSKTQAKHVREALTQLIAIIRQTFDLAK